MKNVVLIMHASLDGFVGGPNGEMEWIKFDEDMFATVDALHPHFDTALYGRNTYNMMESYWPTADENPNASVHTKNHAKWYRQSLKLVVSNSLKTTDPNTKVITIDQLQQEKQQPGKDILMLGSPSVAHQIMDLIDEIRIYVNPIILGSGIPLFKNIQQTLNLKLVETIPFNVGVVALHYKKG
jgi:dihydrofolate reductase